MKRRLFFLFFSLLFATGFLSAQRYASALLEQSAATLHLQGLAELPSGSSIIDFRGMPLCVVKQGDRIDHIGRSIFPLQLKESNPLPIYNYLEFAWLEQSLLANDNPYKYKDVFFNTGDWKSLQKVSDQTPCSVAIDDGLHYRVSWQLADGSQIEVTAPVNYENISTATRSELERCFIEDLGRHQSTPRLAPVVEPSQLKPHPSGRLMSEGERYLLSSINQDLYYMQPEDGLCRLVCDTTDLLPTLANLFCAGASPDTEADWQIHLLFNLHESRHDTLSVRVDDFVDFLRAAGCSVFWGHEGQDEAQITGSLFAYCSNGGYNHIFKVTCRTGNVRHLACTANLFVPTTNVRDLHMQYKPKKENEKIKWQ